MYPRKIRLLVTVLLATAVFVMLEGQQTTTPPDCCGTDVTLTVPAAIRVYTSFSTDIPHKECGEVLKERFCKVCKEHRNCVNATSTGRAYDLPVRVYRQCCTMGCTERFIAAEACAPFP